MRSTADSAQGDSAVPMGPSLRACGPPGSGACVRRPIRLRAIRLRRWDDDCVPADYRFRASVRCWLIRLRPVIRKIVSRPVVSAGVICRWRIPPELPFAGCPARAGAGVGCAGLAGGAALTCHSGAFAGRSLASSWRGTAIPGCCASSFSRAANDGGGGGGAVLAIT